MRPFGRRVRRSRPSCLGILSVLSVILLGSAARAAAQAPWTWEGYFEIVTSRTDTPLAPTVPADAAGNVLRHPVSVDGHYVIFESAATNLGGPPGTTSIYWRDRRTGETIVVASGAVRNAALSSNGFHVAFERCDWPSVGAPCQIFARDVRNQNPATLLSQSSIGGSGSNHSSTPVLSGTGRYVVYVTTAQNLSNDSWQRKQIMWRDRDTDGDGVYDEPGAIAQQVISVSGSVPANGDSDTPDVSDDGTLVAFRSAATNLVPGDTNGLIDVFARERVANTTRRLNVRPGGSQSLHPIVEPHISMSDDGRFVAFASADPLLATTSGDGNGTLDVFIYQRGVTNLTRLDIGRSGSTPVTGNGPTGWPTLNNDGRYVSLQSAATNAPFLAQSGTVQVYTVDRQYQVVTRISGMPDGTEPDAPSLQPSITGGGSLVVFWSSATTFTGIPTPAFPQLHAAARLTATPLDVRLPAEGGQATVRIAAHTYTRLLPRVDPDDGWLELVLFPNPPDNNTLYVIAEENAGPAERSTAIRIGTRTVTVTQEAPVSIAGVSPAAGGMSGGTQVTITGSGFTPDTRVFIGGYQAWSTEFVSATTLRAFTPPSSVWGPVDVEVYDYESFRGATLVNGFRYTDETPPTVAATVTGPLGRNGWYVGDVRIDWVITDPESPVTATTCSPIVITQDVTDRFWCTATTEGGTGGTYVDIRRDATPPTVRIDAPVDGQVVEPGTTLTTYHGCENTGASYSAPFECTASVPSGSALPTAAPGWHSVTVTAVDEAGNRVTKTADYGVWSDTCQAAPAGMRAWLRFEDNLLDATSWPFDVGLFSNPLYVEGRSGRGIEYQGPIELWYWDGRLDFSSAMSVAFWLKPAAWPFTDAGVLIDQSEKYRLERLADGRVSWTLFGPDGQTAASGASTATTVAEEWAHVAFTFDAGAVRLYLNGRLAETATVPLERLTGSYWTRVSVAGSESQAGASGVYDEVQFYDRALDAITIGNLFLARAAGICPPVPVAIQVPSVTVPYGTRYYDARARVLDLSGEPVAGKTIEITVTMEQNLWSTNTLQTDGDGWATWWQAPLRNLAPGTYPTLIRATFRGDGSHMASTSHGALVIEHITPAVTWTPAPITYGTPLGAAQLNATSVPGTWVYTPAAGTVLAAGSHTLSGSFTPDDPTYASVTRTATLIVGKATPVLTVADGTVTYNGQPHPATPTVTGVGGEVPPGALTITYDGSAAAPVNAGTYAVEASFGGDTNHLPASATATLVIAKATPTLTWSAPPPIDYGTPLSAAHLNATASVAGTFTYTPAAGAVLPASPSHALSAMFAPVDAQNYEGGTVSTTIAVERAATTVSVSGGTFTYDGQPHAATAAATGVGGVTLTPVTVTYNGTTIAPVAAGAYEAVATFAGDANHAPASATAEITIGKAAATLSWSAPAAIVYGMPLSTAQLNAAATVPGTWVYAPAAGSMLGAGASRPLTATFTPADPTNYSGGTVGTAITVAPAALTIRTNDEAKSYGAPLPAFTASFSGLVAGDTPASLAGTLGFATTATSSSLVGTYAVTPAGLSSPNYAIAFASGVLSVVKAPVAMTLTTSPTPSGLDMPITFTATVAAAQSAPAAPTGTVRFFDGATLLGTATLSSGTATLLTGGLTAGSHTIEARYDGDASFDTGSRTATHVVNTAAATPAITLTTSRQPATTTQSMTFTATITVATSGTIAFYDGGTLLGSGSIASGRATLTVANLAAGSHAITARFQGNASAPPVISPVLVQSITSTGWKDRTSTVALVSSANASALGDTVTFTATASGSSGTPTGRILFMVDGLIAGDPTGVAVTSGQASVQVASLNGGRHKVTATYLGNSNYRGSNGALTQTVN